MNEQDALGSSGGQTPRRRKILYVAPLDAGNTSLYRLEAFRRLGQEMIPFAADAFEPKSRYVAALRYRYPVGPLISRANRALQKAVREHKPDVVWFDKPVHFHAGTIEMVKSTGATTVCYNQDNPFGPRNDGCWMQFYKVYRLFDLHCLFRTVDVERYREWGLPAIKIALSYDPLQHFPPPAGWSDADRDRGLAYTGSPLEDRPEFLRGLGDTYGLPLSVAGPRWDKAWPEELQKRFVFGGMMKGGAYRESMWRSRINMAFVTRKNEEDVAHKSFEITACAQFLLAERSPGHLEAFEEDREAVFYESQEECADKARYYLEHPEERERIAAAGRARAVRSGYSNDAQLAKVLGRLDEAT
ncbi:glycosyltransferase [Acidipila sp. EB88]|uniref:CgeB family protein n=1 Tax=Acidipila sp. EB88 TaxID=2305226 RepID=UPI000F5FB30E|nr:glycosyltransferase [Acidipila sp. EB88]RRA48892.1 glycosyltransferase family 1 protein [Acidipila sp. EB88]